jgi:hypothetical protein
MGAAGSEPKKQIDDTAQLQQVCQTNGTSLSVDDAAAGSSLHQITYVDTQCFGYS